jgi:hypothetical protein
MHELLQPSEENHLRRNQEALKLFVRLWFVDRVREGKEVNDSTHKQQSLKNQKETSPRPGIEHRTSDETSLNATVTPSKIVVCLLSTNVDVQYKNDG